MSLLPQRFSETSAAKLPVPAEVPPGLRRRVSKGTRVESRTRSVCGKGQWARGVIVGHDPLLDLPLVAWDDKPGLREALADHEYEVEET